MRRWNPFWIITDKCFLLVESYEIWLQVVNKHDGNLQQLLGLKSNELSPNMPDFGTDPKHTILPTLGEWARQNQIDLAI